MSKLMPAWLGVSGLFFLVTSTTPTVASADSNSPSLQTVQSAPNGYGTAVESTDALAEIIVTAQKATQSLQKTPLAVTAVTGADLINAGVQSLQDVQSFAPSARFQEESIYREIYLRGIGSTDDIPNIDPPNSFNVNGVYIPREATGISLFDINDIEVLPGPQSTLYGRSSLGGAVNVTTNRPTSKNEADAVVEAGDYDLAHITIVGNTPLSDTLWGRVALNKLYHDGYQYSGANSADEYAARVSLLYMPIESITAFGWANYDHQGGYEPNLVNKGRDAATGTVSPATNDSYIQKNPWNDEIPAPYNPFGQVIKYPRQYDTWSAGGEVDYNFAGMRLAYIPSYTHVSQDSHYFFTDAPLSHTTDSHQQTHELRLASDSGGPLTWLAGLYGYDYDAKGRAFLFFNAPFTFDLFDDVHSDSHGYAAFGQATYEVVNSLRLTIGGRVASDTRRVYGFDTPVPYDSEKTFGSGNWKVGADYDLTASSLLYANVQTGSQLGTFNTQPPTPTESNLVHSPHLTAFSLGSKNRFADNRVQINDEVYYYDYSNFIVSAFSASGGSLVYNAQKAKFYGNDLTAKVLLTRLDQLSIDVGYLHARYTSFNTPFPVPGSGQTDFDGLQAQYAPNWSLGGSLQHTVNLPSGASLTARADTHYESSYAATFYHPIGGTQSPYTRTDASVTYHAASGAWSFAVWAKNLENAAVEEASAAGAIPGPVATFLAPPRTFGVRLTTHFE